MVKMLWSKSEQNTTIDDYRPLLLNNCDKNKHGGPRILVFQICDCFKLDFYDTKFKSCVSALSLRNKQFLR